MKHGRPWQSRILCVERTTHKLPKGLGHAITCNVTEGRVPRCDPLRCVGCWASNISQTDFAGLSLVPSTVIIVTSYCNFWGWEKKKIYAGVIHKYQDIVYLNVNILQKLLEGI